MVWSRPPLIRSPGSSGRALQRKRRWQQQRYLQFVISDAAVFLPETWTTTTVQTATPSPSSTACAARGVQQLSRGYVNPTTPEQLINLRLSNLRQQNEHVHARHKELFGLFSIPRRLMLYRKGVQLRRLVVMSFFVQNSYYCLQCNHSRYFGHATPPLEEYIPLDEVLRPPPPVNLGEVWDLGYRTTFNV